MVVMLTKQYLKNLFQVQQGKGKNISNYPSEQMNTFILPVQASRYLITSASFISVSSNNNVTKIEEDNLIKLFFSLMYYILQSFQI